MKEKKRFLRIDKICFGVLALCSFFRIWLGELTGVYFIANAGFDDAAMVQYAYFFSPFKIQFYPTGCMPFKEIMFSLYLLMVKASGLPYTMVLSLTWIVAAVFVWRLFYYLTHRYLYSSFAYLLVLFTPIAFEAETGTRLYRNAIIAPFVLMVFTLIFIIILKLVKEKELESKRYASLYLILGIIFAFTCRIKEDGIWLLACMGFSIIISDLLILYKCKKHKMDRKKAQLMMGMFLLSCMPLICYFMLTNVLKITNYKLFGVYETNIRTEGELADFINNVYRVDSDDRTTRIWAPTDAIEKVFDVSETLQQYPGLRESLFLDSWGYGNIYTNPINGDMLSWVLRIELMESGVWQSEEQITELFRQINTEIESAFYDGRLVEDDKFQLLPSTGGKTQEEIKDVVKDAFLMYKIHVALVGYRPGAASQPPSENEMAELATVLLNMNLMPLNGWGNQLRNKEISAINRIISIIFQIYVSIQILLCVAAILGILWNIWGCIIRIKKKQYSDSVLDVTIILFEFALVGISFLYAFGIAWFSSHMGAGENVLKFYGAGIVPMLTLIELFGGFLFGRSLTEKLNYLSEFVK